MTTRSRDVRTNLRVSSAALIAISLLILHSGVDAVTDVQCERAADIVLVLDQSTSIVAHDPDYDNWYVHLLGFAKSVAGAFPIGREKTQVGVMKFNQGVDTVFHLDDYGNRESLLGAIGSLDIGGGDTNIAGALRHAREQMFSRFNGARSDVPKILILITDGTANVEESNTLREAALTKATNIKIFTVGVTNEVDEDQLRKIASSPNYFFFASNFNQLQSVMRHLVESSCGEAATLPTTTPANEAPITMNKQCCSVLKEITDEAIVIASNQKGGGKDGIAEVIKLLELKLLECSRLSS